MTRFAGQLLLFDDSEMDSQSFMPGQRCDPAGGTVRDDEYNTPRWLWEPGLRVFGIEEYDLDPATNETAIVPAYQRLTQAENGLACSWRLSHRQPTRLWLNPPFSQNAAFAKKLIQEWKAGGIEAIVLNKHDHRVGWWWQLEEAAVGLCLVRGYVQFAGQRAGYRFPVSVFFFGADYSIFEREYECLGRCFRLR